MSASCSYSMNCSTNNNVITNKKGKLQIQKLHCSFAVFLSLLCVWNRSHWLKKSEWGSINPQVHQRLVSHKAELEHRKISHTSSVCLAREASADNSWYWSWAPRKRFFHIWALWTRTSPHWCLRQSQWTRPHAARTPLFGRLGHASAGGRYKI